MRWLLDWFDDRTGIRDLIHEALYERIPGGARWRYAWGSTLVFAFVAQVITGLFLWMAYSPSSRTAWESVYYIQYEMQFGWLLRGIHHYMAQAMVVLMIFHLLQVVIDGAYKAPREINYWMGLFLMMIVMGLGLTGYLLPWDQKGYWATAVATNLMAFVPYIGDSLQQVVVGGNEYGHHTLTRFFALHAGVLPGALMVLLAIHIGLFRKHGIKTVPSEKPMAYFWPDQVLKDSVACLAVLAVVLLLCVKGFFTAHEGLAAGDYMGAHLASPADPSEQYAAARPEWYFLFLFEMLKYFTPETMGSEWLGNEFMGAIVAPGVIMGFLFIMPLLGHWKLGHGFNVAMLIAILLGVGVLTARALQTDYYATLYASSDAPEAADGEDSVHLKRIRDSRSFLAAQKQAEFEAHRIREVIAHRGGIPYAGAIELMRTDAEIQGPKLFTKFCASCHSYLDPQGEGIAGPAPPQGEGESEPWGAANLHDFASRDYMTRMLDPEKFASNEFFGATAHKEDDMATYLNDDVANLSDEGKASLQQLIVALSAEAELVSQREADAAAQEDGTLEAGRAAMAEYLATSDGETSSACTDCHKFRDEGDLGSGPDLTGYGSEQWLVGLISDPEHERFYEGNNDRMPAFAGDADAPEKNPLTRDQIRQIARWLRGDDKVLSP
jgi:ubiquinol-cytochrome c reductase cytochrome b subunit